jgi:integrase
MRIFDVSCRQWERSDVRAEVRPVLADVGETAQFFAAKGLALTNAARDLFLDNLYPDLAAALRRLIREAKGDYSPDRYAERFPKDSTSTDGGLTAWQLFERWVSERKPAAGTIESWRYVFEAMIAHFGERSAGSIMPEEATLWIKGLISEQRSAHTVKKTWLNASKTVFRWGVEQKQVGRNPFEDMKLTVPRKRQLRETRAFHASEARIILSAALAISDILKTDQAAKRWVPWLCAYTGARAGEMCQLRGIDIIERDGIHALHITPEAGTVKNCIARTVPLHEHLIDQGFLQFVDRAGNGPLFYRPRQNELAKVDPTKQKKSPAAQVRQRLAAWVRELGVRDPGLSPNHAWRHTFKQIGRRSELDNVILDKICGHTPATEGGKYGDAILEDMATTLKRFPRYPV